MSKVNGCPYRTVRPVAPVPVITIEERFDFQIGEYGKIERISLGEFDLVQEVESHKGEVGLINCLKLAQSRGLDPNTAFAKVEDGVLADVGEIETLDDLIKAKASADARLEAIAKQYGLTTDKLVNILKTGKLDELEKPLVKKEGNE